MDDFILQIVLLLLGGIVGIVTQRISVSEDSKAHKALTRMLLAFAFALIVIAVGWIAYKVGVRQDNAADAPPLPSNVSLRLDFEEDLDDTVSLDVCDAVPPTYYEDCYSATGQLAIIDAAFTGEHSLGWTIESRPERARVYSANFPIPSPPFVDLITAQVFVPDADAFDKIWLLAKLQGAEDQWVFSEFMVDRDGWISLILDLRQFRTESGLPANEVRIEEIDVDIFTSAAGQQSEQFDVRIDDLELVYPAARPALPVEE